MLILHIYLLIIQLDLNTHNHFLITQKEDFSNAKTG